MAATATELDPKPDAPELSARGGLDDRLNPMTRRELLLALRTPWLLRFYALVLLLCGGSAVVAVMSYRQDRYSPLGPTYFLVYYGALVAMHAFVVPYTAYRSMARERDLDTWDLLMLTGLGMRRIVGGKLASALVLGVLYGSLVAPFIVFSYFLNGIDLVQIGVALLIDGVSLYLLTAAAITAATLPVRRVGQVVVGFLVLVALLVAGLVLMGAAAAVALSSASTEGILGDVVLAAGLVALTGYQLLTMAAARLRLPSEPYAARPRAVFAISTLCLAAVVGPGNLFGFDVPPVAALVLWLWVFTLGAAIGTDARAEASRVARRGPLGTTARGGMWLAAFGALLAALATMAQVSGEYVAVASFAGVFWLALGLANLATLWARPHRRTSRARGLLTALLLLAVLIWASPEVARLLDAGELVDWLIVLRRDLPFDVLVCVSAGLGLVACVVVHLVDRRRSRA